MCCIKQEVDAVTFCSCPVQGACVSLASILGIPLEIGTALISFTIVITGHISLKKTPLPSTW